MPTVQQLLGSDNQAPAPPGEITLTLERANIRTIRIYLRRKYKGSEIQKIKKRVAASLAKADVGVSIRRDAKSACDVVGVYYRKGTRSNGCQSWIAVECRSVIVGDLVLPLLRAVKWPQQMRVISFNLVEHIKDWYERRRKQKLELEAAKPRKARPKLRVVKLSVPYDKKQNHLVLCAIKTRLVLCSLLGRAALPSRRVVDINPTTVGRKNEMRFVVRVSCTNIETALELMEFFEEDWPLQYGALTIECSGGFG